VSTLASGESHAGPTAYCEVNDTVGSTFKTSAKYSPTRCEDIDILIGGCPPARVQNPTRTCRTRTVTS
jgi:hypothetical protein